MKTLLLMRHAKSSWKDSSLKDTDRPLNKRGQKAAPRMGEKLKDAGLKPQLILSSPALRARDTAEMVAKKSGFKKDIQLIDSFYMGEPDDYLHEIVKLPDEVDRVLVIGHNPGLEGLMQILSRQIEALPTAGVAAISLPVEHWSEVSQQTVGTLVSLFKPKEKE